MTLHARLPGMGWDEVLSLLSRAGAEGTLHVQGEHGSLDLIFQNGVVLLPLSRTYGSRKEDQRRGNRRLLKALRGRVAGFRFQAGVIPAGTVARRSLVLRQEPLLREAQQRRARGTHAGEPIPALWGDVPGPWVSVILRALSAHRRTGRLVLEGEEGARAILRLEAGELRPAAPTEEALRALRRDVLAVCRAATVRVALLVEGEAADAGPLPPETGRLLAAIGRVEELWQRVQKLLQARQTGYRLRDPAVAERARDLTGIPDLVSSLDGRQCFAEILQRTGLPPLLAAHGLAQLMLEGLVVAGRRPEPDMQTDLRLESGDLQALATPSDATPVVAPSPPLGLDDVPADDGAWPAPRITDSRRLTPIVAGRGPTPVPRRATVRPAASRMRILRAG